MVGIAAPLAAVYYSPRRTGVVLLFFRYEARFSVFKRGGGGFTKSELTAVNCVL